jgi:hypothetical protein
MADYVATIEARLDDNLTAGFNAGTDAMNKSADAADNVTTSLDRTNASAANLVSRYDPLTKANAALGAAMVQSSQSAITMAAAVAAGTASQAQADAVADALATKVDKLRAAQVLASGAVVEGTEAVVAHGAAQGVLSAAIDDTVISAGQMANATREIGTEVTRAGLDILTGVGSFETLSSAARRTGDVMEETGVGFGVFGDIATKVGGYLLSPLGLAAGALAAAAGIVYLGVESLEAGDKLNAMSNQLRATRSDYDAVSVSALAAAKAFAATGGISPKDATATVMTFAAVPTFTETPAAFAQLSQEAKDLAVVLGTTVPVAAKTLADALEDPAKEADDLAQKHFPGFTQSLVDTVTALENSGDKAGALKIVLDTIGVTTDGAAEHMNSLQSALKDLGDAFKGTTGESIGGFISSLGSIVGDGVLLYLKGITAEINAIGGAVHAVQSAISPSAPSSTPLNPYAPGYKTPEQNEQSSVGAASSANEAALISASSALTGTSAAILTALQKSEGIIGQDGTWETSSTGAIGPMQVVTKTFNGMLAQPGQYPQTAAAVAANGGNADLSNTAINTTAGSELYTQLLQKYNGDVWDATLAYHYGPSVADAFINGGSESTIDKTDGGAGIAQANKVASSLGLDTGPGRSVSPPGANTDIISTGPDYSADQKTANGVSTLSQQQQANLNEQAKVTAAMSAPGITPAELEQDSEALAKLKGAYTDLLSPVQQYLKTQGEAVTASAVQGAGAQALSAALTKVNEVSMAATGQNADAATQQKALSDAQDILTNSLDATVAKQNEASSNQEALAQAYLDGTTGLVGFTNAQKASIDALSYAAAGTMQYGVAVAALTDTYNKASQAANDFANAQTIKGQDDTNAQLQLEAATIGQNNDLRTKELDLLKEKQVLENQAPGTSDTIEGQQILANIAANDDLTASITRQQNALSEVQDSFSQAFSSIEQSIDNAFIQGGAASINFGQVAKAAIATVVEEILKLAVISPIINSLTGESNSTLSDLVGSSTSGIGAAASSGGSGLVSGVESYGGTALSVAGLASKATGSGGIVSNLESVYSIGKGLYSGLSGAQSATGISLVDNVLNIPTGLGAASLATNTAATTSALGTIAGDGPETAGSFAAAGGSVGATVGNLAGGVGLGFTAGTLLNDYVLKGNQTNGEIGSAAGAVAGAVAGSVILPGVGTIVGGLIGGLIGGGGGGLIGPKYAISNDGYNAQLASTSQGQIAVTSFNGEGDTGSANATNLAAAAGSYVDQLNQIFAAGLIKAVGTDQLGANNFSTDGKGDAASGNAGKETTDLTSILGAFSLSSSNKDIEYALQNNTTNSAGTTTDGSGAGLGQTVTDYYAFAQSLSGLLDPLGKTTVTAGSLGTEVNTLNTTYEAAIAKSKEFGDSTDALTSAWGVAVNAANAAAAATVAAADTGLQIRTETATGQTTQAALNTQAQNATAEQVTFGNQLIALYGSAYLGSTSYAQQMGELLLTQGAERQQIIAQAAQQTKTDRLGISDDADTNAANVATAQGNPILASQLNFTASSASALNQATVSYTAMLQNGEISQAEYNAALASLGVSLAAQQVALTEANALTISNAQTSYNETTMTYAADRDTASGDSQGAALLNFDVSAQQQVDSLTANLKTMLNEGAINTTEYYAQITDLDTTLAQQRLAVQQQYTDAAKQQLTSTVTSLSTWLTGLETSSASPLSPQAQLAATRAAFMSDASGAAAGNATSLANLSTDGNSFLTASKAVNGSGAAYAADFAAVVAAAGTATSGNIDVLTASVQADIAQTQTQQLVAAIAAVQAEVKVLGLQMKQTGMAP